MNIVYRLRFIKNKILFLVAFVLILGCQGKHDKKANIEDFIPDESELILKINSLEAFKSALKNNVLLSQTPLKTIFDNHLMPIDSLKLSGPLLICLNENGGQISYTFIAQQKDLGHKTLLNPKFIKDSIWVYNSSPKSDKFPVSNTKHPYKKFLNIGKKDATFSLYRASTQQALSSNLKFNNIFLDVFVSPSSMEISGIYTDEKWRDLFHKMTPKATRLDLVSSNKIEDFNSYQFSDFEQFNKNLKQHDSTLVASEFAKDLFETTQEIGSIETKNGTVIALQALDIIASRSVLTGQQELVKTFRSTPIFKFEKDSIFMKSFGGLLPQIKPKIYTVIDDFLLFSESESSLEDLISNHSNKNSLAFNLGYQNIQSQLSDELSFQQTLSPNRLVEMLNELLGTALNLETLEVFQNSTIQIIKDDDLVHFNALIQKSRNTGNIKEVAEVFNINLDAAIIGNAQFVNNHQNKQKDIVVQDIKNQLYLISNQGIVRWKKKISAPILGAIKQVDLFKNGRLQMVFTTENRLYVLDRLGRDVQGFPLKFMDRISQPLAVFDYDKNRNYRFLVTQGANLLMYDGKGKRVKGFKYKPNETIKNVPKHLRYASKDYIFFSEGKQLQILNRRGQTRVQVKKAINFSDQNIFFYKNKFSTINAKGDLVQVDTKGRLSLQKLGFEPGTQITASAKTLVAQWNNNLQIKTQKTTVDYGNFGPPKLFYIKDKIYITINDIQSNKVWFYNSSGELLPDFPIYGTSTVDLANADADAALEFVCQSSPLSLIMYQLY